MRLVNNPSTLRQCIISQPGYTFVSIDASQIELRVAAILSQDPLLLEALKSSDLHFATAIHVFGFTNNQDTLEWERVKGTLEEADFIKRVRQDSVMEKRRYDAKQLNFAILYGADAFKIAEMAGCSLIEAEQLKEAYFAKYVTLKSWIDRTIDQCRRTGFVANLFGRIRPIPDINTGSVKMRAKGEREAVNTVIQGTAVDIVKMMMLYLRRLLPIAVRLVLQVHDEILWEVPDDLSSLVLEQARELKYAFPDYPVNIKIGKCYGLLKGV